MLTADISSARSLPSTHEKISHSRASGTPSAPGFNNERTILRWKRTRHTEICVTCERRKPIHFRGDVVAIMSAFGKRDAQNIFFVHHVYQCGKYRSCHW